MEQNHQTFPREAVTSVGSSSHDTLRHHGRSPFCETLDQAFTMNQAEQVTEKLSKEII